MTDLDEQLAANAALVDQRVSMGDLAQYPRQVDHMALVPKKRLDGFLADLTAAGFQVDSVKKGLRRSTVEFSREDAATLDAANAFTREVITIVDEHDGTYDGWAAFVLEEPPQG